MIAKTTLNITTSLKLQFYSRVVLHPILGIWDIVQTGKTVLSTLSCTRLTPPQSNFIMGW